MSDDYGQIIEALVRERDDLKDHCTRLQNLLNNIGWPPGHFYSPVVDVTDIHAIRAVRDRLSVPSPTGIEIDSSGMKALLERLSVHHRKFPFTRHRQGSFRFHFDNPLFGCHDASVLFSMLLEFKPRRVIEIGSGFSSCLLLDANEHFFDNKTDITLIDPFLDQAQLSAPAETHLMCCKVQEARLEIFDQLEAGDFLFIDSSHVSKTGSDVNFYLFDLLPRLKPGVIVHIHDILYPFEYLESWVLDERRSWNETYLIRAFLLYNETYEILYWNNFVYHRLQNDLQSLMPLCLENEGGSLWLRRRQ